MKYVSAPYSSALDKDQRMIIVTTYSATCLLRDEHVICPLTMGHNFIKTSVKLPFQSEWWLDWCINLLAGCDEMDVLMLPGWDTSIGVTAEVEYAQQNGIKINYIKSEDLLKPLSSQPQRY